MGGAAAFLARLGAALARLAGWPTREGRWVEGSASTLRGLVALAPLVAPRREFRLYVPRGYTRWRRHALLVLCHGCRQTPEDFAQGTRIAAAADARRWLVLMPRQRDDANAWGCWNWFDSATASGDGEAAIVTTMTLDVMRDWRIDRARVMAAGLSAGASLAAILGVRHGDTFRWVVSVAGLACGAAPSALAARRAMSDGPQADVAAIGRAAHVAGRRVPLLAIHGSADDIVAPRNALALVAQYLALAGVDVAGDPPPAATTDRRVDHPHRPLRVRDWRDARGLIARLVEIDGLGHAWSGGDPSVPFNDPASADSIALIDDFLRETC
jgi:poly(hydroxyalkanoate) depolymerase family esterase